MSTRVIQLGIFQSGFRDPSTDIALIGGSAEFYVADGNFTTPKNAYEDILKASSITSVTLDAFGQYPTGLYFDGSQIYDIRIKDSVGTTKYSLTSVKIPDNTDNIRTVTAASVNVTIDDDVILCDTSANAIILNLYAVSDSIKPLVVKNIGATGNNVTVTADGSDLIDGSATDTLAPAESQEYYSDQSAWYGGGSKDGITGGVSDGTITLKQITIPIGSWDMDGDFSKTLALGIDGSKVRSVDVVIAINSAGTIYYSLLAGANGVGGLAGTVLNGSYKIDVLDTIILYRTLGSFFDAPAFNSTLFNRGYVVIWYEG